MKRRTILLLLSAQLLSATSFAGSFSWEQLPHNSIPANGKRVITPTVFTGYYLNTTSFKNRLLTAGYTPSTAITIELPTPDGAHQSYKVWQTPIMEAPLDTRYPDIKTFTGTSIDHPGALLKLDFTYQGIHAMVANGTQTYFIDPYSSANDGYYSCYYKRNYQRPEGKYMACEVGAHENEWGLMPTTLKGDALPALAHKSHGTSQKTYRLALACTIEYAQAVGGATPTKASVLSAMVTTMNRVNGVYERELAVTMKLIGNNDTLIYLSGTDPYTNSNGGSMLGQNQTNIDNLIGSANYDMGHVFSTGGGGIANLGCVCSNSSKARGVTGSAMPTGDPFDIDYVAHEMGHQFGSDHTFNANSGSCSGNGEQTLAYEPGGGTTIMAYAGICGTIDNIQSNSDAYFHGASLLKISSFITTGNGANCAADTLLTNNVPVVSPFAATYAIPYLTPFELTAPTVTDTDHDALTYCWEQWNRGNFRSSWNQANLLGPIFRSFYPDTSATRTFVRLPQLLINNTSYKGEKLPQDTRFLTFKLTVRDMLNGIGTFNLPDDTIHLDVINTGTPFAVTAPNTNVSWVGGQMQKVSWNVGGTDQAPINTSHVDILLSTDGGLTYPIVLAANTLNDSSENILIPNNITTTTARIKIKAVGNVYFDISDVNFSITPGSTSAVPDVTHSLQGITLFPVPTQAILTIQNTNASAIQAKVVNTVGQQLWSGNIDKEQQIVVTHWAKGMYYLELMDTQSHKKTVKRFVVE